MSPMGFTQVVLNLMVYYFSEVQLRSVPTANSVIRSKVPFNLEEVSRRSVPLKRGKKALQVIIVVELLIYSSSRQFS